MSCGHASGKEASNTPSREFSGLFNGLLIVACYLVLSHVPFIHDFDNITPLFSDHMPGTGVSENNRVMLSKS
jgi:hypothetical protein